MQHHLPTFFFSQLSPPPRNTPQILWFALTLSKETPHTSHTHSPHKPWAQTRSLAHLPLASSFPLVGLQAIYPPHLPSPVHRYHTAWGSHTAGLRVPTARPRDVGSDQQLSSAVAAASYCKPQKQRCICLPKSLGPSGYLYTVNELEVI